MKNFPILIIGKYGKTGSRVNQRLQILGYETRAVSRSTLPAFDWENPTTWANAIKGTRIAYVTYQPDLAVPNAEATMKNFVKVARENGLQHIVLLSGRGEQGAQRAEKIIQSSGLTWNIVRCSWFSQNFSESFMLDGILNGELVLPAGDTAEPFVDVDDIAEVVVKVITETGHKNKLYELTGPRLMTFQQCVTEIAHSLGKNIKYTYIPVDTYIEVLHQQGTPEDIQWLLRELFTEVLDGRNSQVMSGVEEVLGRPATDFKAYVQKVINTGGWHTAIDKKSA